MDLQNCELETDRHKNTIKVDLYENCMLEWHGWSGWTSRLHVMNVVTTCCIMRKDLQSFKLFLRLFCELYYIRIFCDSIGRKRISRSIPCGGKNFLFSQLSSSALRHTHTVSYSMGTGAFSPKAKRPRSAASESPPSSAEVNNKGRYTSTPSYPSWRA